MKRNKHGFYYSAKDNLFAVMDEFGNLVDLEDDSFDSALHHIQNL